MISVSEAKHLIYKSCFTLPPVLVPLSEAAGLVLAADVHSAIDTPPFHQSNVDGYAFSFDSLGQNPLQITANIPAGFTENTSISAGCAARIFTGAPLPHGADTVVMQEFVTAENGFLSIQDTKLTRGANTRLKGSQTSKNQLVVQKETQLFAGVIGFLAGVGIAEVWVYPKPRISLVITGQELITPPQPLQFGQIYESNSFALKAALADGHLSPLSINFCADNAEQTFETIQNNLHDTDILLITGGISVGDYDFVANALQRCGVETVFYKVAQRPGKPLFFGKKDNTLVFALPGNPASVLTCFYEYVVPVLRAFMGKTPDGYAPLRKAALTHEVKKVPHLTHFMRAKLQGNEAQVLNNQESYKMNAYIDADCFAVLEAGVETYQRGELVEIHVLNQCWN